MIFSRGVPATGGAGGEVERRALGRAGLRAMAQLQVTDQQVTDQRTLIACR
jgi:hypothetical protein